jgi:hypothetical protein
VREASLTDGDDADWDVLEGERVGEALAEVIIVEAEVTPSLEFRDRERVLVYLTSSSQ